MATSSNSTSRPIGRLGRCEGKTVIIVVVARSSSSSNSSRDKSNHSDSSSDPRDCHVGAKTCVTTRARLVLLNLTEFYSIEMY